MPQSLSRILLHLIFSTKNREPYLTPEIRTELHPYLTAVLREKGCPASGAKSQAQFSGPSRATSASPGPARRRSARRRSGMEANTMIIPGSHHSCGWALRQSVLVFFLCLFLSPPAASFGQDLEQVTLPKLNVHLKPLDAEARVALYVSTVAQAKTGSNLGAAHTTQYPIELTTPISDRLSEIVQHFFPRTTTYREKSASGSEEMKILAEMALEFFEGEDTWPNAVKIHIVLTVTDATGSQVATIKASSSGRPQWTLRWSRQGSWARIVARSLDEAFDQLVRAIPANKSLKSILDELAKGRALPARVATTVRFSDETSLLPNGRLDAGDEGILLVQAFNHGPGPAYGVAVKVTSDRPQILLAGQGLIGDLKAGEKKEIGLHVAGSLDLPSTVAKLRIETTEKRGYGAQPVLFELPTHQLVPPKLEIADVTLNDRSGRAKGDGDGQPGNGETIEAVVRIRNAGVGEAAGVLVTMASPKGAAEILESKVVLPRIATNEVGEARLLFRLPVTVQASDLSLAFRAVDARGAEAGSAATEQTWKIRAKRPGIELAYRLYDGGSAGSVGNRDGQVNNGERIEVAVTPTNRGELVARGVRIAVQSDDPKLIPRPAVLEVGDLPAQAEGTARRFGFEVPRAYARDRPEGDLHFSLVVSQQDFPVRKEPVSFTFHALRPDFSLEANTPPSLTRGSNGEMVLRLRNTGALRAEDVVVEATSEVPGLDVLDERGVPVRSRKIAVGTLETGSMAPLASLSLSVRRNAALGPAPVHITVSQKDFPQLARTFQIAVTEEAASVITAPRSEEPAARSASVPPPMAPATISFLQNTPGQYVPTEAIVLRFEVQASMEPAEVRLTQNDRLLTLEAAQRSLTAAGGLQAVQYEIPVRLTEGENRFEVVTVTRQGLRSARSLILNRSREVGRIWVVAIGVSKYQDPSINSLVYADADARAVYEYFRDTFHLPTSQVFLRTNEQATLREIKSILGTQLAGQANDPRDTVVLYFAGHGMWEQVTGSFDPDGLSKYFLPYDTSRADLYSTALEMDEITNILHRLVPDRVMVLLDSCFSGAAGGRSPFSSKAPVLRAPISDKFLERMAHAGKGRIVLAASGPDESAQESSDFGHGVFTYFLLEGLHGAADENRDGEIDMHEIYSYVFGKVVQATDGKQKPELKEPDLVGQILIGRGAVHRP